MDAPVSKTVLSNGIRILSKQMPYTRSVSMGVWVDVGARDETSEENGLSHFIEHMIFKGTQRRTAFEIAKEFDAVGGHTNAFTSMENTCYHARVLDENTDTMVDILTDIFLNSVFAPVEIERERSVILQEIGMVEDSPDEYVHHLCGQNFWGNHSLGRSILGTPENILRFGNADLTGFFHRLYQPDRIVVALAGNVNHDRIVEMIGESFGAIQPGNGFPPRVTPRVNAAIDINHRLLEQTHICISAPGLPITDSRRYALSLLNTTTGGNMSSRLFQEIREKRGLAYAVYSFVSSHVDIGMFGIYMAVDPQQSKSALKVALDELGKIVDGKIEADELQGAVDFSKGSLLMAMESSDNQMVRMAQNEIHFGDQIELDQIIAEIESVSVDDVVRLARQLFRKEEMALTMLGPNSNSRDDYGKLLHG
jgi:predicted Zn-dependent peptidase